MAVKTPRAEQSDVRVTTLAMRALSYACQYGPCLLFCGDRTLECLVENGLVIHVGAHRYEATREGVLLARSPIPPRVIQAQTQTPRERIADPRFAERFEAGNAAARALIAERSRR